MSIGIYKNKIVENFTPDFFNEKSIAIILEKYSDVLLGLKIRFSIPLAEDVKPLKRLVEITEKYNTSVCVHTTNPPCSTEEIANTLIFSATSITEKAQLFLMITVKFSPKFLKLIQEE